MLNVNYSAGLPSIDAAQAWWRMDSQMLVMAAENEWR